MIRIGSSFHVPGIRFQSDPSGTVFAADLRRGTEWSARTAGRSLPAGAPREDGSAARIQWAAAEKRRAFPAKLFISTSVGIAGFGPLSDQTALALEDAASGALGVEKENLIAAAAGPVLEHYPVGSMMEALQAARAQPFLDEPRGRGAEALGLPFRIAEGALEMGAAVFHAERTGGEVWIAATSAGIRREVLEGVRDRLWLAGPAAWRASSGIHPGDVLILLATGASPIAEVTSEEDPRTESVIAGLSTALSQLVRKRALAAGFPSGFSERKRRWRQKSRQACWRGLFREFLEGSPRFRGRRAQAKRSLTASGARFFLRLCRGSSARWSA